MSPTCVAELLVGLDVDLPGPAELVEIVDVVGAQVDLQRVEDVADRDAQGQALGAVDVEVEPGRVRPGAVDQAVQARRVCCPGRRCWSLTRCSSSRPRLPRSSMMSLKPPVVPRPSTGGPPKVVTSRVRGPPSGSALASLAGDGVGTELWPVPLARIGLSMTYIEPRLGALAFRISDWPETPTVCYATPGVLRCLSPARCGR